MQLTYNKVIEKLQAFADSHLLISSFGYGTENNIDAFVNNNTELPLLYATLQRIELSTNTQTYSFRFVCLDSRVRTVDNLKDVLSDTARILNDLRSVMIYSDLNIWSLAEESTQLFPLVNNTADWLSGWEMPLNIMTGLMESDCENPTAINIYGEL